MKTKVLIRLTKGTKNNVYGHPSAMVFSYKSCIYHDIYICMYSSSLDCFILRLTEVVSLDNLMPLLWLSILLYKSFSSILFCTLEVGRVLTLKLILCICTKINCFFIKRLQYNVYQVYKIQQK